MRRSPTKQERDFQRARISAGDMQEAVHFIEAAIAIDTNGKAEPSQQLIRLALEIAAIICYGRPFTDNDPRPKKKRKGTITKKDSPAVRAERSSGKYDLGSLTEVLSDQEARKLHRSILQIRHRIVAHSDPRYFPVRLVKAFLPPSPQRIYDFAIKSARTHPRLDLHRFRANAHQLRASFGLHTHAIADEVRKTRKRLRSK